MDIKNKPGCRCCSPCDFTCSGTFPTIGGFVLDATVTTYTSDYGSCDPCYWNITLPLNDTIDSLSDPDIDISGNCCNFSRTYTSPCCEYEQADVTTNDTGWQFLNSTTERRTVSYFCAKYYIVQRVTISIKAFMCEEFDGFVSTNQLFLTVSYKWEFSVRYVGYGQSIQYTRPTGGGPETVFFFTHLPADFFVGPINTCSVLRSYTSDFLAANTDCLCFPDFAPYSTYKDDIEPCDDANYDYFVERVYRIDWPTSPVIINDCCELLSTHNLVFVAVNTNASGFNLATIQAPTETLPAIYSNFGSVTLQEPCVPSNVTAEIYGEGCGEGTCVYEWDGSNWTLLTDNCTSLGCECAELPTAPGDAPGDQLSFPCINCP